MRNVLAVGLLTAAISACGKDTVDTGDDVDAAAGNFPPPRIIPGGGIGDGAIDGVVNLYVIDDATRRPIAGAAVRVGTLDGTTDATGLFVARGVVGPQTVAVKAPAYRAAVWIGGNGANMTVNLEAADPASSPSATVSGQIAGFGAITVAAGHTKDAIVGYAQTDDLGDPANSIAQSNNSNACFVRAAGQDCPFTIKVRPGKGALIAAIFDRDLNGTPTDFDDDKVAIIRWAYLRGLDVAAGATQTGKELAVLAPAQQQTVFVDFGSPPLAFAGGLLGIELGDEGVFQLPAFATRTENTFLAPRLDAIGATAYRLTGISSDADPATQQSVVLRRDQTGSTVTAGTWLPVPSGVTVNRTGGSWTSVSGATVHSLDFDQGSTRVLSVTVFDGSTKATIPDLIAVPSGSLKVTVNAIGAPGLDVSSFSLDADVKKLVQVAASISQL